MPACISHAGLHSLCGMTQLAALDLSGHAAISDAGIAEIARHLTRLTHLDLRKPACDNPGTAAVTDAGIAALGTLTLLESVRLSQAQASNWTTLIGACSICMDECTHPVIQLLLQDSGAPSRSAAVGLWLVYYLATEGGVRKS